MKLSLIAILLGSSVSFADKHLDNYVLSELEDTSAKTICELTIEATEHKIFKDLEEDKVWDKEIDDMGTLDAIIKWHGVMSEKCGIPNSCQKAMIGFQVCMTDTVTKHEYDNQELSKAQMICKKKLKSERDRLRCK